MGAPFVNASNAKTILPFRSITKVSLPVIMNLLLTQKVSAPYYPDPSKAYMATDDFAEMIYGSPRFHD